MSYETGIVCNDVDALMARSTMVDIGFVTDELSPLYPLYGPNGIVYSSERLVDKSWLLDRMMATDRTPVLGQIAMIGSPFNAQQTEELRSYLRNAPSAAGDGQYLEAMNVPFPSEPPYLPTPDGAFAPNDPRRMGKRITPVRDYGRYSPGGLYTTTDVPGHPYPFLGAHMDDWFGLSLDDRINSPNRMGVNLGTLEEGATDTERAVVIGDIDVGDLRESGLFPADEKGITYPDAIQTFLRHEAANGRRHYAIIIRHKDGEGYISPSEAVLHDGKTFNKTPTLMGYWIGNISVERYRGLLIV